MCFYMKELPAYLLCLVHPISVAIAGLSELRRKPGASLSLALVGPGVSGLGQAPDSPAGRASEGDTCRRGEPVPPPGGDGETAAHPVWVRERLTRRGRGACPGRRLQPDPRPETRGLRLECRGPAPRAGWRRPDGLQTEARRQTQRKQRAAQRRAGDVSRVVAYNSPHRLPCRAAIGTKTPLCAPRTGRKAARPQRRLGASSLRFPGQLRQSRTRAPEGPLPCHLARRAGACAAPPHTHTAAEMGRLHDVGVAVPLGDLHRAGLSADVSAL